MKIIVDKEARDIVQQLCDAALRVGGIKNLTPVKTVLDSMEEFVIPKATEPEAD